MSGGPLVLRLKLIQEGYVTKALKQNTRILNQDLASIQETQHIFLSKGNYEPWSKLFLD